MPAGDDEEVTLGSTRRPGGHRWAAAAAAGAAVVTLMVVIGDDGSSVESPPSTSVTRPAPVITVPTPSSTLDVDDAGDVALDGVVLLGSNQRFTHRLDLATGVLEAADGPRAPLTTLEDGSVVAFSGIARWQPDPFSDDGATILGDAAQVVDTGAGTAWLLGTATDSFSARLVDVRTGEVRSEVSAVAYLVAVAGSEAGLVGEIAGGVYQLAGDGSITRVATGVVLASAPGFVLYQTCDEQLQCDHRVRDLAAATEERVALPVGGGSAVSLAPGGRAVLMSISDTIGGVALDAFAVGDETASPTRVDVRAGVAQTFVDRLAWAPDGSYVAIPLDGALLLITAGGAATTVELPPGIGMVDVVAVLGAP